MTLVRAILAALFVTLTVSSGVAAPKVAVLAYAVGALPSDDYAGYMGLGIGLADALEPAAEPKRAKSAATKAAGKKVAAKVVRPRDTTTVSYITLQALVPGGTSF